ncbi:unnamed protein product [Prorocentrum cordatum]|uniref:Uncharacterized protein n=1 Tax=Prorocentrum cordatum TaxID=2364126 RepID=A0ABN9SPU0_9DINO|nr:unnamed protein product [Polarella glacialis]
MTAARGPLGIDLRGPRQAVDLEKFGGPWHVYTFLVAGGRGFAVAELRGPGHGPVKLATRKPKSTAAEPALRTCRRWGRGPRWIWMCSGGQRPDCMSIRTAVQEWRRSRRQKAGGASGARAAGAGHMKSPSLVLRRIDSHRTWMTSPRAWAHAQMSPSPKECRDGPSLLTCTDVLALPPGGARGPWGPAPPGEGAGARDLRDAPAAGLPRAPRPRRLPSHRAAAAGRRGQTCDGTGLVTKAFGCQAAGTRLLAPRSGEPRSGPARSGDRSGACRRLFRCGQGPLLSAVAAAAPAASYFLRAVGVLGIARTCALLLREGHRGASLIV